MRHTPRSTAISAEAARAQLKQMLSAAMSLDHFTIDQLARSYAVPVKIIEYELTIARNRREAERG